HALTTSYEQAISIKDNTYEVVADLIASGIDPAKSTLFVQSYLPEHAELHLILSMITPLPWLERVPTYKSKMEELKGRDLNTYGFLGYPVLQAADILMYMADAVPVGKDQAPHLELTREIARRFNFLYKINFFKDPVDLYTDVPVLPGTDGRKMSKSYDNAIFLADEEDVVVKKIKTMFTDPQRLRRTDPGNPDVCGIYAFQKIFGQGAKVASGCRDASIGCVDCKKELLDALLAFLKPMREKRQSLIADKTELDKIILAGNEKARKVATNTLDQVKKIIKIN
ncbi:MAG: tryptophan--tRNA ligase, partial [Candidatus Riflemargulisbacteria bacterium]